MTTLVGSGRRRSTRMLCAACDAGSPTGADLLAWFTAHPLIGEADVEEFAGARHAA